MSAARGATAGSTDDNLANLSISSNPYRKAQKIVMPANGTITQVAMFHDIADNGIKTLKNVGIVGPDWTHSGAEALLYLGDPNHTIRACCREFIADRQGPDARGFSIK